MFCFHTSIQTMLTILTFLHSLHSLPLPLLLTPGHFEVYLNCPKVLQWYFGHTCDHLIRLTPLLSSLFLYPSNPLIIQQPSVDFLCHLHTQMKCISILLTTLLFSSSSSVSPLKHSHYYKHVRYVHIYGYIYLLGLASTYEGKYATFVFLKLAYFVMLSSSIHLPVNNLTSFFFMMNTTPLCLYITFS
jgi:hypothetical protein